MTDEVAQCNVFKKTEFCLLVCGRPVRRRVLQCHLRGNVVESSVGTIEIGCVRQDCRGPEMPRRAGDDCRTQDGILRIIADRIARVDIGGQLGDGPASGLRDAGSREGGAGETCFRGGIFRFGGAERMSRDEDLVASDSLMGSDVHRPAREARGALVGQGVLPVVDHRIVLNLGTREGVALAEEVGAFVGDYDLLRSRARGDEGLRIKAGALVDR